MLSRLKDYSINFLGWRTNKRLIVFESDDWGSERIPSNEGYLSLLNKKSIVPNPYYLFDALEDNDDLLNLFEALSLFTDVQGHHPIITANFITANPDFDKIEGSGFSTYYFKPVKTTLSCDVDRDKVIRLWSEGINAGLVYPQLHGREHLDVKRWMEALRAKDPIALDGFRHRSVLISEPLKECRKRKGITAAFDYGNDDDICDNDLVIRDASSLFFDMFGYYSESFIAPAYTWSRKFESSLAKYGIKYIQTLVFQTEPAPERKNQYRQIFHYTGQKNRNNQLYMVRNSFFEPSINPNYDWVDSCLSRIQLAFSLKKPAIIGTHRVNFIGHRDQRNQVRSLLLLTSLIKSILKNWPDVEFISSSQLGNIIEDDRLRRIGR